MRPWKPAVLTLVEATNAVVVASIALQIGHPFKGSPNVATNTVITSEKTIITFISTTTMVMSLMTNDNTQQRGWPLDVHATGTVNHPTFDHNHIHLVLDPKLNGQTRSITQMTHHTMSPRSLTINIRSPFLHNSAQPCDLCPLNSAVEVVVQ